MPTPMHELQGSRTDVNEGGVDGVPLPLQSSFLDTTAAAVPSAPLLHPTADLLDLKQGFFSQIGGEPNAGRFTCERILRLRPQRPPGARCISGAHYYYYVFTYYLVSIY